MVSLESKRVSIYFDDHSGYDKIAKKEALILSDTGRILIFRNAAGFTEAIPWYRIIRVIEIPDSGGEP